MRTAAILLMFAVACGNDFQSYRSRGVGGGGGVDAAAGGELSADAGDAGSGPSYPCEIGSPCEYKCPNGRGSVDLCSCIENRIDQGPCQVECQELLEGSRKPVGPHQLCGGADSGLYCVPTNGATAANDGRVCMPICTRGSDCASDCCALGREGSNDCAGALDGGLCSDDACCAWETTDHYVCIPEAGAPHVYECIGP